MWDKLLHKYLRVPYILNVREFQSPKPQVATVILLHGIGSSLNMWTPHVKKMPSDVRIIALDLLGFGASPQPEWGTYSARVQADSVATTLFSMKIVGPVVIVGHSLGSLVAVEFARRYPLMTKSVVLISPPLYKPDRNPGRFDFKPEEVLRKMYDIMHDNPEATERVLRMAGKYYLINPGFSAVNVNVPSYLASLEAAVINQQSYRDILRIKRPIHIVSGKLDALVLDKTIKDVVALRPNVIWKSVIGGHEIIGNIQRAAITAIKSAVAEAKARDDKSLT